MTNPSRTGCRLCRRTGLFAVAVTAPMVLSGCTSAPSGADGATPLPVGPYSYAANPCPEPVLPGLSLPPLGGDFVCGTLTVPQDRARPDCGAAAVTGFLDHPSTSYRPPCLDSAVVPPFATATATAPA